MTTDPTDADREAAAGFTLASGEWIQEDLLAKHFAAHRLAAAKAERERVVGLIKELYVAANEWISPRDLERLMAVINHAPLLQSAAELLEEQIGRAMNKPDKYPSID